MKNILLVAYLLLISQFSVSPAIAEELPVNATESVWEIHWNVLGGPRPIIIGRPDAPKACDSGQIAELKMNAKQEAVDACETKGLKECRALGATVVVNGPLRGANCLKVESEGICERSSFSVYGCIIKARAVGSN